MLGSLKFIWPSVKVEVGCGSGESHEHAPLSPGVPTIYKLGK